QVWMAIIASLLAMGPTLWFLNILMLSYRDEPELHTPITVYIFNLYRCIVLQENFISPQLWVHRFVFFFWYAFCLYVYVVWSGMLITMYAIPSIEKPVESLYELEEAVKVNGKTFGTLASSSIEYIFKYADSGLYKKVYG
ncbi:unnamed protein product, partial [Meganyctiphanes norvegica]